MQFSTLGFGKGLDGGVYNCCQYGIQGFATFLRPLPSPAEPHLLPLSSPPRPPLLPPLCSSPTPLHPPCLLRLLSPPGQVLARCSRPPGGRQPLSRLPAVRASQSKGGRGSLLCVQGCRYISFSRIHLPPSSRGPAYVGSGGSTFDKQTIMQQKQVLEAGNNYHIVSVKGLELQETSCHSLEATRFVHCVVMVIKMDTIFFYTFY